MLSGLPYTEIHRRRSTPAPMQVSQSDSVQANPVRLAKQEMIFALFPSTTGSGVVHIEDPSDRRDGAINQSCMSYIVCSLTSQFSYCSRQDKKQGIPLYITCYYCMPTTIE